VCGGEHPPGLRLILEHHLQPAHVKVPDSTVF
jgi:hypothetical protein